MVTKLRSVFFPDQKVVTVTAIVPEDLARAVVIKAKDEGVSFTEKAGILLFNGWTSTRETKALDTGVKV